MERSGGPLLIMNRELDNVAIALRVIREGESVEPVTAKSSIPKFHKVAIRDIQKDAPVRKYGQIIGFAREDISAGSWVHTENLHMGRLLEESDSVGEVSPPPDPEPITDRYFLGFRDASGRAATRNYILIASTVDCSAHTVELAVQELNKRAEWYSRRYPNVDGIVGLTHNSGCGIVELSAAHIRQNLTIRNLLDHPNVGAKVVVQLGCEKGQADLIVGRERLVQLAQNGTGRDPRTSAEREAAAAAERASTAYAAHGAARAAATVEQGDRPASSLAQIPLLTMQERGGTWKSVEQIVEYVETELLPRANARRRVLIPAAELILATQCGGSDAASGFTANAAIGVASDLVVRCGGTSFLSETTETFGAGHLLIRRAKNREVAEKYVHFVSEYRDYLERGHGTAQNNLAHGNRLGGLTTIAEKALGSIAKAGSAPLSWVCDYGERVPGAGLGFMNGPAFDPASATGQIAGGALVGLFSTGRGSCFGGILTPWIKIVSNTETFDRIDDMEINAGRIADGTATIDEVGREIFEATIAAASGARTYSEKAGYSVVNIWNSGVVT